MRRWVKQRAMYLLPALLLSILLAWTHDYEWGMLVGKEIGQLFLPHWNMRYEIKKENHVIPQDDEPVEIEMEVLKETEETVPTTAPVIVSQDRPSYEVPVDELKDDEFLLAAFYQVDPTTYVDGRLIHYEKLMSYDLKIDTTINGPKVLIYHTHSTEGYLDSRRGEEADTVVGVGDYLASILEKQYGIEVLHHRKAYDKEDKANAYLYVARDLPGILESNPSIQVVIDLHRDGVKEDVHLLTEEEGKKMAQIMFFNGICQDASGNPMPNMNNENLEANLAFSFQMQMQGKKDYRNLVRKIYLRGYRYNMQFCKRSMLVEVGAQNNTVEEAKNAMEPLARMLSEVILP